MQIKSMFEATPEQLEQAAQVLYFAFRDHYPDAWPTLDAAREEIRECVAEGLLALMALADDQVIGWIGGRPEYDGNVWELHPMVVAQAYQRSGVGVALVNAFEAAVFEQGGLTIWLGSDDEQNLTSLGGVDLYPDLLQKLQHMENLNNHPFGFYQKQGFVLAGVLPDANGWGKPDIFMAKRVTDPQKGQS